MSASSDGSELLLSCASGSVYRCLADDFSSALVGAGHTSPLRCASFAPGGSLFATGTAGGELRVWDIIDYACQVC